MGSTAIALTGFALWLVMLTYVLAAYRLYHSATTGKAPNTYEPDGSDTPGFGRRLTRARDNCFESLPVFAAIAIAAFMSGRLEVTDPLAPYVLSARFIQSVTHVVSIAVPFVVLRATAFVVQLVIYTYWSFQLLG
ncbi:MAG: MAPEG family protein [Candidatus Binatia bacterium]